MGLFKALKVVKSAVEVNIGGMPRWARIVGVGPPVGDVVTLELEIHYGYGDPFPYSARTRVPNGMTPEVGQEVAIRQVSSNPDYGLETTYDVEWGKPPQHGLPRPPADGEAHPVRRLLAAKRARDEGAISDAEFERAKEELRGWAKDRGID
jgi:hypothetical protein